LDSVSDADSKITLSIFDLHADDFVQEVVTAKRMRVAIAEESLRTYEPAGGQGGPDTIDCTVVEASQVTMGRGGAGWQLMLSAKVLLDGLRKGRYVRLFPESWPVSILPIEERLPREFHSKLR